jgi:hypothetical protein
MNIYLLWDPELYLQFARFSAVGTWKEGPTCKECEHTPATYTEPFQVEWEPESDNIGDFSWSGYSVVVKATVGAQLVEKGIECSLGRVEFIRPTTPRRKRKIVPFPYEGPKLKWLMPTKVVALDLEESGIPLLLECRSCGRKKYKFKTKGLVIPKANWHGVKMFRLAQFGSQATFVTEEGKKVIEGLHVTNVTFKKAGIIA